MTRITGEIVIDAPADVRQGESSRTVQSCRSRPRRRVTCPAARALSTHETAP